MGLENKVRKAIGTAAVAGALYSGAANAQNNFMYDDFNSGSFNSNIWNVSSLPSMSLTPYSVNNSAIGIPLNVSGSSQSSTVFQPTRNFVAGESLEFNLSYNAGTPDNAYHFLTLDNNPTAIPLVGWYEGFPLSGISHGNYTERIDFGNDGIGITVTRPDNSIFQTSISYSGNQHSIGLGFYVGDSGNTLDFNLDNVQVLNAVPEPSSFSLLGLGIGAAALASRRKNKK